MYEEFSMLTNHYELEEETYNKNRAERLAYAVGDVDVWSFDGYLLGVIHNGLIKLAQNTHGWPSEEEYPEFEDWIAELNKRAAQARWLLEYEDINSSLIDYYLGELESQFGEQLPNGNYPLHIEGSKETEESREDYNIAFQALYERKLQIQKGLFKWLGKWLGALWD